MKAREQRMDHVDQQPRSGDPAADRAARFGQLPSRILPEQMVEEIPADPPNDPHFGRNPENDWLIRYSF